MVPVCLESASRYAPSAQLQGCSTGVRHSFAKWINDPRKHTTDYCDMAVWGQRGGHLLWSAAAKQKGHQTFTVLYRFIFYPSMNRVSNTLFCTDLRNLLAAEERARVAGERPILLCTRFCWHQRVIVKPTRSLSSTRHRDEGDVCSGYESPARGCP